MQLPGRQSRFSEPLISDLSKVIEELSVAIVGKLDLPYIFFGHSLGALIAHTLLMELVVLKHPTAEHLVVSGRSAPSDENEYFEKLTHLPDDEFLEGLSNYGGTPTILLENMDLMEIYLPILRSDFLLSDGELENDTIPLDVSISVFAGRLEGIEQHNLFLWEKETNRECNVTMFPGGHFFINTHNNLVLNALNQIIKDVMRKIV